MLNHLKMKNWKVLLGLALAPAVWGVDPIVLPVFSFTTGPLQGSPDPLPSISGSWDIPKYDPALYGGLPLTAVQFDLTTTLTYDGFLTSELLGGVPFQLQVRSDFNFAFPGGLPGSVSTLDPAVILNLVTPNPPNTPFAAGDTKTLNLTTTATAPGDLALYTGVVGNVNVPVTGALFVTAPPMGVWHNNTDNPSSQSPATFIDNIKVNSLDMTQLYQLQTTLTVTYFVPETQASLSALLGLGAGMFLIRRRK